MASKIVFMLLLCSSLLVYLKIPYIGYGLNNLFLPFFALLLVALNLQHFNEVFRYHCQALFFLFLFYVWMWVSALFSDFQTIAIKYSLRYSIHFILLVSFLILTYKKRKPFSYYRWILRFLVLLAVFGIVEYLFYDLWFFSLLRSPQSLMVYPRISSLMQWPNQLGILMCIGIPLGLLLHKEKSISTLEFYFGFFLLTTVISLTASRYAWLFLLLGILLAWLWRVITLRKGLFIVGFLVFCILFFPVSTHQLGIRGSTVVPLEKHLRDITLVLEKLKSPSFLTPWETLTGRVVLWKAAIDGIIKRPITGMGIQVYDKVIGKRVLGHEGYHTHNLFLNILVELGIPGLLLFLILIYSLLKRADLYRPIIGIPLIMIFAAQLVDFFMHDFTFTTIGLYFLAEAGNSKHEDN